MSDQQIGFGGQFDMGRVVKETFAAAQKHFVVLLVGAVVLTLLPQMILLMGTQGISATEPLKMLSSPAYIIGMFATLIGGAMLQAYVIYTVVQGHQGKTATIPEAFMAAVSKIIPLFILAIVTYIGLVLGMVLLIVPGIILGLMWTVSIPALVVENIGPMQALGRSRNLTRGSRGAIFFLILAAALISFALSLGIYGFNFAAMSAAASSPASIQFVASLIIGVLSSILFYSGSAAIYSELRMIKEGVGNQELATVFE
jgi:hypothetical protein